MSLQAPCGEEEAASFNGLREFFCRSLRRGHWELARACLPQLSRGPEGGGAGEILRGLIPAPHLLRWDEERRPQKIAWFWSDALDVWLGQADVSSPSSLEKRPPEVLRDETEFLLLLEEFQDEASEEAVKVKSGELVSEPVLPKARESDNYHSEELPICCHL